MRAYRPGLFESKTRSEYRSLGARESVGADGLFAGRHGTSANWEPLGHVDRTHRAATGRAANRANCVCVAPIVGPLRSFPQFVEYYNLASFSTSLAGVMGGFSHVWIVGRMMRRKKNPEQYSVVCQHCGKGYRAIMASHLRYTHHYVGENPVLDYKRRFGLQRVHCGETREQMSANNYRRQNGRFNSWTRGTIVAAIKRKFRAVKTGQPYRFDRELAAAARKRFGSWHEAARRAGISLEDLSNRRQWDRAQVIAEVRRVSQVRETRPIPASSKLRDAASRFFGSWPAAVRAAGIDAREFSKRRRPRTWTAERVLEELRNIARRRKRDPDSMPGRIHRGLHSAACRYFGSIEGAARRAHVDYKLIHRRQRWSKATVIAEIRRLARRRSSKSFVPPSSLRQAGRAYFGSWEAAVRAAGIDSVAHRQKWKQKATAGRS